jgi:hypothetical protein
MSSRQAKNPGLSHAVWQACLRIPVGQAFMAADLLPALPALNNCARPLAAIGAALKYLRSLGGVEVVAFKRLPNGPTCKLSHYARIADTVQAYAAPDVPAPVARPGVRHVRLLDAVHWHREPSDARPWRGYESGLARIA